MLGESIVEATLSDILAISPLSSATPPAAYALRIAFDILSIEKSSVFPSLFIIFISLICIAKKKSDAHRENPDGKRRTKNA